MAGVVAVFVVAGHNYDLRLLMLHESGNWLLLLRRVHWCSFDRSLFVGFQCASSPLAVRHNCLCSVLAMVQHNGSGFLSIQIQSGWRHCELPTAVITHVQFEFGCPLLPMTAATMTVVTPLLADHRGVGSACCCCARFALQCCSACR